MNWIKKSEVTTRMNVQTNFACIINFCGSKPCSPVLCNTKSFPK